MSDVAIADPDEPLEPRFLIGSYVLETLTTGMYVEPRDCIREYVQNAFDAIRSARETRTVGGAGRIDISIESSGDGFISIRDTGLSIPTKRVWETLTAIGASRKSARRQAGFRGIGRLAGIAYCDRLEFTCKAPGEAVESKVVYDCVRMRQSLREGDEELEPVFRRSISMTTADVPGKEAEHYTVVTLHGLGQAPSELKSISALSGYLRIVAPVDFRSGWNHGEEIRRQAETVGQSIPTTSVFIGPAGEDGEELHKPYTSTIHAGGKPATIRSIRFFQGGEAAGARWWGWYAETPLYGIVNDDVAGFRLRAKNIQLGGADILNRTMQRHGKSYARFSAWHIGEIYIDGDTVFPNARRDGLEDSQAWRDIEGQIAEELEPLVRAAYTASKERRSKDFATVKEQTDQEIAEVEASLKPPPTGEPMPDAKATARKLRAALRRIDSLNLDNYSEEQQTELREAGVRLRALAEKASVSLKPSNSSRRSSPSEGEVPHRDILDVVFDVLQSLLDTRTFNRARKALIKRFKDL